MQSTDLQTSTVCSWQPLSPIGHWSRHLYVAVLFIARQVLVRWVNIFNCFAKLILNVHVWLFQAQGAPDESYASMNIFLERAWYSALDVHTPCSFTFFVSNAIRLRTSRSHPNEFRFPQGTCHVRGWIHVRFWILWWCIFLVFFIEMEWMHRRALLLCHLAYLSILTIFLICFTCTIAWVILKNFTEWSSQ